MHCFTETWEVARAALDLGFHISFSGIVTFKNAHDVQGRGAARSARSPADRDRCAVSRAGAVSRQAQPAGLRAARRGRDRAAARHLDRGRRARDDGQFLPTVRDRRRPRCDMFTDATPGCAASSRHLSPRCSSSRCRPPARATGAGRLRRRRRQRPRRGSEADARGGRGSRHARQQRRPGARDRGAGRQRGSARRPARGARQRQRAGPSSAIRR